MATTADAELILHLYKLRGEAVMRKARAFVTGEMSARSTDDLLKVQRGAGTQENAYWRQVVTYWEMAASFVLRGALDADLFLDSSMEGVLVYSKFHRLYKEATGVDFMPKTAELVAKFPAAEKLHAMFHKRFEAQAQDPIAKAEEAYNKG